ncbi:NHL repeat-containing protein [Anaeromyxobacter diazotrophicus]|uniref:NHL repeat containing protein n=1 Tax=Anaeromyxobacter diazotrophicus TaxID=2590199 RepID=A0A7I9VKY3_9BACT|nr:NHL repeat-containing protein [Anaeromyxobacter diazotrophicus]GEJ57073.1 hypothetical protein AMYX_18140 [Anaeromyxobacter diazotrophicus]
MTVPTPRKMAALLAGLLLVPAAASAEPVAFLFEQALYQDAKEAPLKTPEGVACSEEKVVVADTGNGRLLSYPFKNGRLGAGAELKLVQVSYPTRVQLDSHGGILVLDGKTHRIARLDDKGAFGGLVEPRGVANASSVVVGSFKVDASDNLYLLDVAGRRVLVLEANGGGRQLELPAGGQFTDVAVDAAGTLYALDAVGAAVWAAEKGSSAFHALTKGMKDRMNFPVYLTARQGKLFLVDAHGNGIVVLGIDGSFQGRQLSIGWNEGFVYYPSQLCFTQSAAFVADRYNNRVQEFSLVQ